MGATGAPPRAAETYVYVPWRVSLLYASPPLNQDSEGQIGRVSALCRLGRQDVAVLQASGFRDSGKKTAPRGDRHRTSCTTALEPAQTLSPERRAVELLLRMVAFYPATQREIRFAEVSLVNHPVSLSNIKSQIPRSTWEVCGMRNNPRTSALCVRGPYYEYNVRGYAVIPVVDIRSRASLSCR